MRFDDRLRTILAADTTPGMGAQSAWRQLVDLLGRGLLADDAPALARLAALRDQVPLAVRAASSRALAFAAPSDALVALFAADEPAVAAPVLRTATLDARAWVALLPRLDPTGRAVLRHRRDLPAEVTRALEAYGATDFQLPGGAGDAATDATIADAMPVSHAAPPDAANDQAPPIAPLGPTPFVTLGEVARGLPLVAEALRHVGDQAPREPATVVADAPRYEIADLVARLDAFNRERLVSAPVTAAVGGEMVGALPERFRWHADADAVVRWVEGIPRAMLVGVSLAHTGPQATVRIDAVPRGAWCRRDGFRGAGLEIDGTSATAGSWRLAGTPVFDPATGRFTGFTGTGRRPRRDEAAEPPRFRADSLRQLVHELRTPANAIAGFAELIGTELFGPVPALYRSRASTIGDEAAALIAAIGDLDTAARIEGDALELRPAPLPLAPLLARIVADVQPIAARRGATLAIDGGGVTVCGDDRAVERLIARLLATVVAAAQRGEAITLRTNVVAGEATLTISRPAAFHVDEASSPTSPARDVAANDDTPLLGTAFAVRLARDLADALGGALEIRAACLTLRLPLALTQEVGQAATR